MEQRMIDKIMISGNVTHGISKLKSSFKPIEIFGIDTETDNGRLYSIQISSDNHEEFILAEGMKEEEILDRLFSIVGRGTSIFFAHNLEFELGVMFPDISEFCPTEKYGYKMKVIYPHPAWMSVRGKTDNDKFIQFMDSMLFFKGSLEHMAEKFNMPVKKMKRPKCVEEGRKPKKDEFDYFKDYAMADARIAYFLGKEIMKIHKDYNVDMRRTVSPATLSSKVFRSHYVRLPIPFQQPFINLLGMRSYNGGRTESFVYGTTKCRIYDFNSAYPFAMANIPIPVEKKWKKVSEFSGEVGFYILTGEIPFRKVSPLPFRDQRLLFPVGKFKNIFVTGYEAKHIFDIAKIEKCRGWVYIGNTDDCMKNFVLDFYAKKKSSVGDISEYHFNKLILNSNYGKYYQLNPTDSVERHFMSFEYHVDENELVKLPSNPTFKASGMFNPVIASWITGFARSMLYEKLNRHEDKVLYCDTDSVITKMSCSLPSSDKLGDLKLEKEGLATILREKLYLVRKGNKIIKSGLHGFWKNENDLLDMIQRGENKYRLVRMVKLREAFAQGKSPFVFEGQDRVIDLSPSMKREVPQGLEHFDFLNGCIELDPIKLS